MKILLTGATGYIAKKLLPVLLSDGHEVVCCVRDPRRFDVARYGVNGSVSVITLDLLKVETLSNIPDDIDVAYYLVHSMASTAGDFALMELESARNFNRAMERTAVQQVIYLSGIINETSRSKHLASRKAVEDTLSEGPFHLTALRSGIIVGSGSASFEIMRDLVEKLPLMIAPRWLHTRSQPIAIHDVIEYLRQVILFQPAWDQSFDIGGPDILTYKEMLLQLAEVRGLKRRIGVVPVMTPRLSSYWLYFITSTSYSLASHLVNSMKAEAVCGSNNLGKLIPLPLIPYRDSVRRAFDKIEQQAVWSSWTDAITSRALEQGSADLIGVPEYGCLSETRRVKLRNEEATLQRIWQIGGDNGWYWGNWLWRIRGFIDKMAGGPGLNRGRKHPSELHPGDALDFWRVILADKENKRLILYAEMRLPGEAWLEFSIREGQLIQKATFRPLGLAGRVYWYALFPVHLLVFSGMSRKVAV